MVQRRRFLQTIGGVVGGSTLLTGTSLGATTGTEGDPPISIQVKYRQSPEDPERVALRASFEVPDSTTAMAVRFPPSSELLAAEGFNDPEGGTIEWDADSGNRSPQFTVESTISADRYPIGDDWAVGSKYFGRPAELTGATWSTTEVDHQLLSEGVVGDGYIHFGPSREWSRETSWGSVSIVRPPGVDPDLGKATLLDAYETAGEELSVNGPADDITVFAVPDYPEGRGRAVLGDILAEADLGLPYDNTWLHEYVHTQQDYGYDDSTQWLQEGLAEYYGYSLLHELDGRTYTYEDYLSHYEGNRDDPESVVLNDRSTWNSRTNAYLTGSLAAQVIDVSIRVATDGDRTFQEVFRRLNDFDDGPVGTEATLTHDDFLSIVEDVGGKTPRRIADYYVGTDATPVPVEEKIWNALYRD